MAKKLTRQQIEDIIRGHLREIEKVMEMYAPDDNYLTMCIKRGTYISANNTYWDHEDESVIDFVDFEKDEVEE